MIRRSSRRHRGTRLKDLGTASWWPFKFRRGTRGVTSLAAAEHLLRPRVVHQGLRRDLQELIATSEHDGLLTAGSQNTNDDEPKATVTAPPPSRPPPAGAFSPHLSTPAATNFGRGRQTKSWALRRLGTLRNSFDVRQPPDEGIWYDRARWNGLARARRGCTRHGPTFQARAPCSQVYDLLRTWSTRRARVEGRGARGQSRWTAAVVRR